MPFSHQLNRNCDNSVSLRGETEGKRKLKLQKEKYIDIHTGEQDSNRASVKTG